MGTPPPRHLCNSRRTSSTRRVVGSSGTTEAIHAPPILPGPFFHQNIRYEKLNRLIRLIEGYRANFHDPVSRTGLGGSELDYFGFDAELIARANRARPANFIHAKTKDPSHRPQRASDQKPHCYGSRVPAAGGQASQSGATMCRGFLEMKRFRIVRRGK